MTLEAFPSFNDSLILAGGSAHPKAAFSGGRCQVLKAEGEISLGTPSTPCTLGDPESARGVQTTLAPQSMSQEET